MKTHQISLLLCLALNVATATVQAAEEDAFQDTIRAPSEQAMGYGRSAIWTLPLVATQYQPSHPTPAMQAALQAQQDGRFLEAMILLDDARKGGKDSGDAAAELNLLRASFLLQGNQSKDAIEGLAPLLSNTQRASDAYALTTMAYLQQGKMPEALEAAQHAHDLEGSGILAHLALSYALQASGRLAEARAEMHTYNTKTPAAAITLAREAELALTLDQSPAARALVDQAQQADARDTYVIAVSGLVYLIDGHAQQAKSAFETALKRDPKDAKALLGLGLAEIKLGNVRAGQEKLQAANESDPGNALILTYLGRSQQQLGQTEAAKASWHKAQQADPKDPVPWLYQAQAQLQANQPMEARESLREAQARLANRSVYRGEHLLKQDEQLLQANLAEVQRQLGMEALAFQTLSDSVGEKNSATLRNQADVLQGQRFAESARRSLLLQSQFNAKPGSLPAELDIYGDGFGQTGAATPQHGVVSGLNAPQASYNDYDGLFNQSAQIAADATAGNQNSSGEQVRAGVGSDSLGVSIAQRQYKTDGLGLFSNLDNHIWQAAAQWRPSESAQAFFSYQTLSSLHGEMTCPADPVNCAITHQYDDNSSVTRLGLRYSLSDNSELRALVSRQQTDQTDNWEWMSDFLPLSSGGTAPPVLGYSYGTDYNGSQASSAELQYRRSGADYAAQWGVSAVRSRYNQPRYYGDAPLTNIAQQIYVNWQQALNPYWQLQVGLAWDKNDKLLITSATGDVSTYQRSWLPKFGIIYTPDSATHVRLAAWKSLDDAAVGNASLAPTNLAGIVLNRSNDTYKLIKSIALAADRQLDAAWLLEGQTQRRWTDEPYFAGSQLMTPRRIDESHLALHWQPSNQPVNVTLAYEDEYGWIDPTLQTSDSVQTQHLRSEQLGLRWMASSQWSANLIWSHNQVSSALQDNVYLLPTTFAHQDTFNQTDASLNWRFNRKGSMDMGVRNATNAQFQYTEMDPLIPRFSKGRLWYARLKLAW